MSIVAFSNSPHGVVPVICMQSITLIVFDHIVRKRALGFIKLLKDSNDSIIDNSGKTKFDIWDPWTTLLFK